MNFITRIIDKVDAFQRKHPVVSFPYAVIKKYGADNAGYLSAIITYYGLLSLFPVLIVFTTMTQLILKNNAALRTKVSTNLNHYFPTIGNQLQHTVHSPSKTGIALAVSLIILLYGARGGVNAFQYAVSLLWYVPKTEQPSFLKNILRSFGIMVVGGIGLAAGIIISAYTTFLGHAAIAKILVTLLSTVILWLTFIFLFKLAIAGNKSIKSVLIGSLVAAVGLQILQIIGSALLAHEKKEFNNTYGTFTLVIALMFWIYLQAQVVLYAVEINVIVAYRLYPRSLREPLTKQDKAAYARYAKAMKQHLDENVEVTFGGHQAK